MGSYLGSNMAYGMFEKQNLMPDGITKEFVLNFKVGSSSSILVISNVGGLTKILEPNYEYTISDGGTKIVFVNAPEDVSGVEERLYIIYLGKQLSVPARLDRSPLLVQKTITHQDNLFEITVTDIEVLTQSGTIVFKNGIQQRYGFDFTLDDNKVNFINSLSIDDAIDVYVFGGVERLSETQLNDESITPNKLNLTYGNYSLLFSDIITQDEMTNSASILKSQKQLLGKTVKIKLKFSINLGGVADNKIRVKLPVPNNGDNMILSSTTISTNTSFESGIVRWGGKDYVDIYRQFGVNYLLNETYIIETVIEYEKE
jgi:hypothetical protein